MQLRSYVLIIIFLLVTVEGFSQVTLSEKNTPFPQVIKTIEKQTGYLFIYDEAKIKLGNVSVDLKNASLEEALRQCFKNMPVTYNILKKNIVLKPKITFVTDSTRVKVQEALSITGKVTSEKGEIIPGAIVFLADTRSMTAANNDGVFNLGDLQAGTYVLVVKMLGFSPYTQSIIIQDQPVNLSVKLTESNTALQEIVITGKTYPNMAKYMDLFIKNFIGETPNAAQCKILNPEVIKLYYDKKAKILQATSNDFIVIENQALGYRVNYLLLNFQLNTAETNTFSYEGNPYFEQLKGTDEQQKTWNIKRKIAYEGSIRHFFKALFNNTTENEGFYAYLVPNKINRQEIGNLRPINASSLFSVINNDIKLLNLNKEGETKRLYIVYTREEEPSSFYYSNGHIELPAMLNKKSQVSHMESFVSNTLLYKNGSTIPANSIVFEGYWTREKVADLMPLDYATWQSKPAPGNINAVAMGLDTVKNNPPADKVSVEFDKPYYTPGDTIRMKAYAINNDNEPSTVSKMVYIDLINDKDSVKTSLRLPITNGGMASGAITLSNNWSEGNYHIRAYTNCMREHGKECFSNTLLKIVSALPPVTTGPSPTATKPAIKKPTAKMRRR